MAKTWSVLLSIFWCVHIHAQRSVGHLESKQSNFNEAIRLAETGFFELAHSHFLRCTQPTEDPLYQYYLAYTHLQLGHPDALWELRQFSQKYPSHPKSAMVAYDLGSYFFKEKKFKESIEYFSKVNLTALSEDRRIECNFKLAYAYLIQKDLDKAAAAFQRIKSTKNKYTYSASYYLGYIYYKKELYQAASQHLRKAMEFEPYRPIVPVLQARIYSKEKKYDSLTVYTERTFEEIQGIKSAEDVAFLTADAYFQKNQFSKATYWLSKFEEFGGAPNAQSNYRMGFSYFKLGKYSESIEYLKKVVEYNDTLGQYAAYYLGCNWLKLQKHTYAQNAFAQAMKMDFLPQINSLASVEYTGLCIYLGQYQEALNAIQLHSKKHPNHPYVERMDGYASQAFLFSNDYLAAIRHIESSKSKSESISRVYQKVTLLYALRLFNSQNFEEALFYVNKSLSVNLDKVSTHQAQWLKAECLFYLEEYSESLNFYKLASKNWTRLPPASLNDFRYGYAYALYNSKEYAQALDWYKDFVSDKSFVQLSTSVKCDALLRTADCYYATKKYNEAIAFYDKVCDNTSSCSFKDYALLQKATILAIQNKDDAALKVLNELVNAFPNSAYKFDAWYNMGLIEFENTKYDPSVYHFEKVIAQSANVQLIPLALHKRALAYFNQKKYAEALEDYRSLLRSYPQHKTAQSALIGIQDISARMGKSIQDDSTFITYKNSNTNNPQIENIDFEEIKSKYFAQEYKSVQVLALSFITNYSASVYAPDVYYYLADAHLKLGDKERAIEYFEKTTSFPQSNYYKRALQRKAEYFTDTHSYESAITVAGMLMLQRANPKDEAFAANILLVSWYELGQYDSSFKYAQALLLNEYSTSLSKSKANYYCYLINNKSKSPSAKDWLLRTINESQDQYSLQAQYTLAESLIEEKNYNQSLEVLFLLNKRLTADQPLLGKSFLLIAQNYIYIGEYYQAKATLASILDHSKDAEVKDKAQSMLMSIENK